MSLSPLRNDFATVINCNVNIQKGSTKANMTNLIMARSIYIVNVTLTDLLRLIFHFKTKKAFKPS